MADELKIVVLAEIDKKQVELEAKQKLSKVNAKINVEPKISNSTQKYYNDLNKLQDDFNRKNLNAIDFEIKRREEASRRYSSLLKQQMQQQVNMQRQVAKSDILKVQIQNTQKRIENLRQTFGDFGGNNTLVSSWQKLFDASQIVTSRNELTKLNAQVALFKKELKSAGVTSLRQQMQQQVNMQRQVAKSDILKVQIQNTQKRIENLRQTFGDFGGNNTLVSSWQKLFDASQIVTSRNELTKLNAQVALFKKELKSAGVTSESFGKTLAGNFGKFLNWFLIGGATASVFRGFYQIIDNVKQLDSAMVELQKVTNATDAEFSAFLDRAKAKSVELGSSLVDLVRATSDFSRLGFSLPEAEILGQNATIYANVGDDIGSIDEATSSIISTMKAFNIEAEDSIEIVDKFNEVGNRFAISSGGIGEALKRSAAAMMEAGNTIDQSIALTVAANNVIQDPDTVGKHILPNSVVMR